MPLMTEETFYELTAPHVHALCRTVDAVGVNAAHMGERATDGTENLVFVVTGLSPWMAGALIERWNRLPQELGGSAENMTDEILSRPTSAPR